MTPCLLGEEEAVDVAARFRLLGDPTRVRILVALLESGELCVCDIAAAVETNETKVSQAMRLLRQARVVGHRRAGRNIFYRLDDSQVRRLLDLTRERHELTREPHDQARVIEHARPTGPSSVPTGRIEPAT